MEQKKEGLLPSPMDKGPKLRRKLQKSFLRHQSKPVFRSSSSASRTCEPTTNKSTPTLPPPPRLPPPSTRDNTPEVSERREGRFYQRDPPFAPLERLENRAYIVPEFSHLIARDPPPQPPSRSNSTPASPRMRRRAKTPIFSIGQLEDIPRPGNGLGRTSSVDLIADQYRAVLESRRSSVYSEDGSGPPLPTDDRAHEDSSPSQQQRGSAYYFPEESPIDAPPRMVEPHNWSPTSDDGTLVSFQDETVYFKPVSFSPEPESPLPPELSRQTTADDNVSLQICLDLLTRDLSSAMAGRPCRSSVGTSALQVLVMIEAYERLRDQMAELSQSNEQARSMEMMFDMWLRALYTVHDSMTASEGAGDRNYGADLRTREFD